ncbi:GTPase CgtA [Parascardovia denticolens IPLA 20019]|uniref:GTPase ObgE n=1 Tax=Parascardovia denticolens TaxID=78258 RepID=UPI000266B4B9|nr:GTPase ObgE [Parascardovia denticolens]EIT88978.1 GTPase CgtA [Parascardovia denticolens IPLA 20019]
MADFVDRVTVHAKGGDGGNGAASIKREKYKPLAGPDGGDGGRGGSVIVVADPNTTSLLHYRFAPHRTARNGTMGKGDDKDGAIGQDLILPVPVGTVVFDVTGGKKREVLADLQTPGDQVVVAKGGLGGQGNRSLANKARRAPGFALLGEPGQERDLVFELKSIADVALVGYPSAGKSSLVAAMSAAKPKIADYPFTTLVPNLGVVQAEDKVFTMADVPGLIPGAAQGKGLGLEFLRHIERTEVVAHVIDCATVEAGRDPLSDYQALEKELKQYEDQLDLPLGAIPIKDRPRLIILNKVDVPEAKELAEFVKPEFEKLGLPVVLVSTATHEGLRRLTFLLSDMVSKVKERIAERNQAKQEERVLIKPLESSSRPYRRGQQGRLGVDFFMTRNEDEEGNIWFVVTGEKPERWVVQTNFDNEEAVGYLADRLARFGVEDALKAKGAHIGDEVYIGEGDDAVGFDWDPTISAGAEMLDSSPQAQRGHDARIDALEETRTHRRTNSERRREYHEWMDAKTAVREAMEKEREAGHWADPSRQEDRHDEHGLDQFLEEGDSDGGED